MLEDVGRQLAIGVQHDGEHPAQSLFDDWVGVVSVRSRERKLDRIEACHAFSEALILMNRPCGLPRACTSHPSATKDMKIGERRARVRARTSAARKPRRHCESHGSEYLA